MKHLLSSALALAVSTTPVWSQTEIAFSLWGSPHEGEVWNEIARAFETANPEIKVTIELADRDSYWEKLRVRFAGGTPPDVFAMSPPLYPDWKSRDVLLNLQPMIDKEPGVLDGIYPVTLETYQTPDGCFGLPRDFQTIVLYYNKDIFDASGMAYPNDSWTWADLAAAAKALTLDNDKTGKSTNGFWPKPARQATTPLPGTYEAG